MRQFVDQQILRILTYMHDILQVMKLVEQDDRNYKQQNYEQIATRNQQLVEGITPFTLIQLVGSSHRYQFISLILWCLIWFLTGCILLGTPFLVQLDSYDCTNDPKYSVNGDKSCTQYVCSLSKQNRQNYLPNQSLITLASELIGDNGRCQDAWKLDIIQSMVYFGSLLGYISISVLSDNIGRKKSLLVSFGIAAVGIIITAASFNIYMAGIGLFLTGFGSDVSINICFFFISETVKDRSRMKHSIIIQFFFSFGCLINVGYYYFIGNWRIIYWIFLVVPSVSAFLMILLFIQETPYYLITKQQPEIIKNKLVKIAKINGVEFNLQDLQSKISQLQRRIKRPIQTLENAESSPNQSKKQHTYTPLDLIKYPSIRFISISVCIISFFLYIDYYGPLLLIGKFSFSIYINAVVVSMSQIIIYPFCYYMIDKWKRRRICVIITLTSAVISAFLIPVVRFQCNEPDSTSLCTFLSVIQLILIFSFRFCASLEFAIFLVYCLELFPTQVKGMGIGISSAFGTVASTLSPYIFGSQINSNQGTSNLMIFFLIISIVCALLFSKLPETLGVPIPDQIKQIEQLKSKGRQFQLHQIQNNKQNDSKSKKYTGYQQQNKKTEIAVQ